MTEEFLISPVSGSVCGAEVKAEFPALNCEVIYVLKPFKRHF